MDKRGIIKLSVGLLFALLILILVFSLFFSSASTTPAYTVGEEAKIDLSQYAPCSLKLKTPSTTITQDNCEDKFSIKFNEEGEYVLDILSKDASERMKFQVYSKEETQGGNSEEPQEEISEEIPEETIQENSVEKEPEDSSIEADNQELIKIGEPVKNIQTMNLDEERNLKIKIPESAGNISVHKDSGEEVIFKEKQTIVDSIQNVFNEDNEKSLIVQNAEGEIHIEYSTPGPEKTETEISEDKKQVSVSSEEGLHYENVLAYTELPREISDKNQIKVYWKEQGIYLDFQAYDTNNNGLLDYIEWIVPHLSGQTFDIIIITKAEHLSSDKTFISDIYEQVKELDDVWSEEIPDGDYVRVTFEKKLTNINDITLYPRVISGNPSIEVYEKDSDEKIADFNPIISNDYNKVLLSDLIGLQDTFDLRIVGGSVEFDYIVDPETSYNVNSTMDSVWGRPTSSNRWLSGTNSSSSQYANLATENGVFASVGPLSNNDYPFYRFNFTINEPLAYIDYVYIKFTGYDNAGETGTVYVWRFANSTWMPIGTTTSSNSNITRNITSDISSYIDSSKHLVLLVEGAGFDVSPSVDYLFVDYAGVTVQYTSETIPPTYNKVSVNSTVPDEITRFAINVTDNVALHPNGAYIFSTNNSEGTWTNDSAVLFTTTPSWANVTKTLNSTPDTIVGYRWYFNDTLGNTNSTLIYVLTVSSYPPVGAQVQCEESGGWKDCSEIGFSETLTRVAINCTGSVINASLNLTNIPDGYTFFNSNATSNETTLWIYDNPDLTINDSGMFNLSAVCYGPYSQSKNFANWTVPWGDLSVDLVSPSSNSNVNDNQFFNFTASVTCTGGECGNVNMTLDPATSWWDVDYLNRKMINITNPSSYILVQNYSMLLTEDTTGEGFLDDGADLRIVYWNGTHNIELDRFNETAFDLTTTNIWFRIQSNISPGGYDDNYYMYYNNSNAVNPPNNGSNVFEFFDDFNRPDSGTVGNGWTETTGTWEIINNWVRNTNNGDSDLTRATITNNHSLRAIANQVVDDADLKLSIRAALSPTRGYTFGYQNGNLELTTGNHNTANLGSVAVTTFVGVPYELEINAFNDRITAYKDGLIFNVTDSSVSSGFTLLHSWDVSEFDDVWVRKLLDIEPTYSLGNSETATKGIISMITGETPFYTTTQNPMDYLHEGCLENMKSGNVCNVTWQVNATGKIGTTWEFFVYANTTNYTNYFNSSDISTIINITIGNLPPAVPELNFPVNNSALGAIGEFNWSNSIDPTGDPVYYAFEISNSSDFSYLFYSNYSIPEQEGLTGITPTGITAEGGYYWRVLATDLYANSSWSEIRIFYYDLSDPIVNSIFPDNLSTNTTSNTLDFKFNVSDLSDIKRCSLIVNDSINDSSTNITKDINLSFQVFLSNSYYSWKINCTDSAGRVGESGLRFLNVDVSNNPPVAREIECEKNSAWYNCSSIGFGDTLTRVRVRCTDPEEGVVNATLNLTNTPDGYNYFYNTTTDNSDEYWTFDNPDIIINDSGEFNLRATCYDSEALQNTNSSAWVVPWGSLTIDLLNPTSDTSVMKDAFFTFNTRINCVGGECGDINVTLDPANWWNETWYYRKTINITNSGSTTLSNFTAYLNISKESSMQNNFYDIRFINGSCGSSSTLQLDYEVENYTSSKADVWIRIPSFVPGANQICMYYGNSFVSSGQNPPGTWNSGYMMVQHLEETGTGTRTDSSSNFRNMSTSGYDGDEAITGKVDGADILDGSNDALNSTSNFLSNSGSFTLEGWIKPRVWGSRISLYGQNDAIEFFLDGSNTVMIWTSGGGSTSTAYPYSLDTWHYVVAVGTGSSLIIYFDGAQAVSGGSSTANYGSSSYSVKIGEGVVDASGGFFNGSVDEVRISNTPRSADWINQSYQIIQNQNTFVKFGEAESKSKGIISTIIGATPFYTTTQNPLNSSTTTCLGNMKSSGGSCELNWSVNATGELNSVWEFFVSAHNSNYWDYFNTSSDSSRIYITIASQVPPSVPQLYRPLNATAFASIPNLNWTNSTDPNGDPIYYAIEVSNMSDFSIINFSNYSIPETSSPTGITPTGITQEGTYYWRVLATDLIGNSSWSETRVFYYDLSAPTIDFINQTGEDNRIINDSDWLNRGENMTIFVNVTDVNIDKVWVVIWQSVIGGVEKVKIFFTYLGGFLWRGEVPTNQIWEGNYNYTIYANDTLGSEINYSSNFTVLGGNASINITPSSTASIINITAYGHVNLTNTTDLINHPINLWVNGQLLFLSNLTPIGTYDFSQEFLETSNSEFSRGSFYNIEVSGGENLTLSSGQTYGNFTRILDAGALVNWTNISWVYSGESCSGVASYQEGDSNSYSGTRDTYIDSGYPTTNYANSDILIDGSPTVQRGLIKFDDIIGRGFNQIPENSTINNANLTFTVSDTGDSTSIYHVLENWTENQATYNNRLTSTAWAVSGCGGNPSRSVSAEASFTPSSTGTYTINISNSTKSWVSGGSQNYGWVFDIATSNGINIRNSEYTTQSERPLLMVDYQADDCTNVIVYVRMSNDKITWTSWQQVSNGGTINSSGKLYRYMEYKVELTSVKSTMTPVLQEITLNYTAVVTDSNGDYMYNFTSPSSFGTYPVVINTSYNTILMNDSVTLSVETGVAPVVYLISPSPNQWFNYGELNITYNTTDLNNDFAFSELIINGAVNQTNSTPITNYAYNNFTVNFSSGQYNWTVNVTDNSGYRSTASERTFYIDLIDPNVSLIYPENESPMEVNELNLSFNATDNMDSNLTCSVVLDGNTIHSGVGAINGNITNVSSGLLGGGLHYWNVTCTDNAMRNFTSLTYNFNISDTPPNVTLYFPTPDYLDNDGILSFIYYPSDNTGFTNCSLIINDTFRTWNESAILNNQNNSFDVEGILEGYYNWTVECFDLGLNSYKPSIRNFTMDLYAPTIDLNLPVDTENITQLPVSFNFTVNDTMDSLLSCNLTINGSIVDTFDATSGILTNRPIINLTDGLKYWNVTCKDDALHSNTSSTRMINISVPPLINLTNKNNSRYNQTSINLTYTPYDNTNLSSCNLYLNGIFNQTNSSPLLNNQENNFTLNGLQDGVYNWSVYCNDSSGLNNQSETRKFYIDTAPPQINLYHPDGEGVFAVNISFNFTVIDFVEENLSCNLTVNSSVMDVNFTAGNGSVTTRNVSGITDGYHVWNVTCWDGAGNLNTSNTFNFTRYTNPQVTLTSPDNNTWFNTTTQITLIYLPEDDEGVTNASLFINGVYNRSNSTPIINQNYNNFTLTGFSDNSYFWNVNVSDITGLTGIGEERRFYIDTAPPSLVLNFPNESQEVSSNNVSFNFTVFDNLAQDINCTLFVDEELESSENYSSGSNITKYATLGDGDHSWNVICIDQALNSNSSSLINFTVKAPPIVVLNLPSPGFRTTSSSIDFNYTPYDPIDITNCSIYLDGAFNDSNSSILKNTLNNFTINGIAEGAHNWTVNCSDSDGNWNWSLPRTFYRDISPPNISLQSPANESGLDRNQAVIIFSWLAIDALDNSLTCDVTIDGIVRINHKPVSSNISASDSVSSAVIGTGWHAWNATCWDTLGNSNTSNTWYFNLTYPDFSVNASEIYFNNSSPAENESVNITATVRNLADAATSNVLVRFYDGIPGSGGTQIGSDTYISLSEYEVKNVSLEWKADLGTSVIFVSVDESNSFTELNETNNNATKNISVGSWEFFYGNITTSSQLKLADSANNTFIKWILDNFTFGNVYITDYDAYISWDSMQAIGKTKSGADSSSDFQEIDSILNSSSYEDSVYSVYTNSGVIKYKTNLYLFNKLIQEIPIFNSTNNSNFVTGILWDTSKDTGGASGEFDTGDREDLIFVAPVNKQAAGTYGTYDYEIRVPAKLREYNLGDSKSAAFYMEIF